MTLLFFILGLSLLVGGAELLVGGASRLARAAGIRPVIVGLTVVAFGTSAPELAVTVTASLEGRGDVGVGNVVGSNVMNVLLILGLSAAVAPLVVAEKLVRVDVPIMIGASVAVWLASLDGRLARAEGAALFVGVVAYVTFLVREARREAAAHRAERVSSGEPPFSRTRRQALVDAALVLAGLAALVLGADLLVESAVVFARAVGLSELVIGLTIVAIGTSLPELAASLIAAARGERDLAVGNVVGSNIFNLLAVLGAATALSPEGLAVAPSAVRFDLPILVAVAVACLPFFVNDYTLARWEGALFVLYYCAYLGYLLLRATEHDALPAYSAVMELFVLPLTAVTLLVLVGRAWTRRGTVRAP